MTISLTDADIRAVSDMKSIIGAIDDVVLEQRDGHVLMPPRVNLMKDEMFLRVMPAFLCRSGVMGYKSFHGSLATGVRYVVVLIRESDGEILAVLDAAYLTALRTGATSGVASRHLARDDSTTVGLIGSGLEAETNLAAIATVRSIETVHVYSPNTDRRQAFAARMSEFFGIDVRAVASPRQAVEGRDIVIVATNSGANGPVTYKGEWLEPGQHIVSIGSTSPFLRELDGETFARATSIVFDVPPNQVFEESGDLAAIDDAALRVRLLASPTLPDLLSPGVRRRDSADITLFKSVGTAAQDLAAAKAVFDLASQRGSGRELGILADVKLF